MKSRASGTNLNNTPPTKVSSKQSTHTNHLTHIPRHHPTGASKKVPNTLNPWRKCDLCFNVVKEDTTGTAKLAMKTLQCRSCMLVVHDGCYETTPLQHTFKDVSDSTPVNPLYSFQDDVKGGLYKTFLCHPCNDGLTPFSLKCKLCPYHTDDLGTPSNDPDGRRRANAFHKLKAYHGDDDERDEGWYCHTICAIGTENSWVWGADEKGNYEDDNPTHHYQLECRDPKDFKDDEGLAITSTHMTEHKNLICSFCKKDISKLSKERKKKSSLMCVQCTAGEAEEFYQLGRRHSARCKSGQGCMKAFHVGCARYANLKLQGAKIGNKTKFHSVNNVFFYPGIGRDGEREVRYSNYCRQHAKEIKKNLVEGKVVKGPE
ncbi:hypothetical protein TrCOL_g5548 [Triparma columacea]|uniref:Uncharacterized protein n=1 Tax=Triparma columacea TaxID=722753 RepID=A0A9W7GPX6_9STRA|nr:hypothetical protein TrCOL_g5548 [Triparma columacea]